MLTEMQVAMRAIGYLSLISHAICVGAGGGGPALQQAALDASAGCAERSEAIARHELEGLDVQVRMRAVEDAMRWLLATCKLFDEPIERVRSTLPFNIPFASDIQTLASISYQKRVNS
jgi:hypothetical protein